MILGIRTRLVIAFIIISLLPIFITAGGIGFGFKYYSQQLEMNAVDQLIAANEVIKNQIQENFTEIYDYDTFHQEIQPLLEKYHLNLQVMDLSNNLIYDSADKEASQKRINMANNKGSLDVKDLGNQLFTLKTPIFSQNEKVAEAKIYGDPHQPPFNSLSKLISVVIISIILGVISFIGIIILSTWYLSGSILKPLRELNTATENITQGNLDYEIKYKSADEFGRFCSTFDLMRKKLKEALMTQAAYEKSRQEMIASISHDLRTPVSSVKGYVEGLIDGIARDEEMVQRYLKVIKNKTDQLDRLIDDLSQFSKLELNHMENNLIPLNSREVFENLLNGYKVELENTSIDFHMENQIPSEPIMVDKLRIEQVLDNLIINAQKHVKEDGYIGVGIEKIDQRIVVAVRDNGIGISNEDFPYIFDRFYRGDKSRSREYGGLGLGLAICRNIIHAHGGEIWAESNIGKGSIFYFSLPIKS